jgi:hypothetical protein
MTYIIAEPCIDIKDKSCVDVCPVDCIHEFGRMLVIDGGVHRLRRLRASAPSEAIFPRTRCPTSGSRSSRSTTFPEGASVIDALADEYATEHNVQNEAARVVGLRRPGDQPVAWLTAAPLSAACEP